MQLLEQYPSVAQYALMVFAHKIHSLHYYLRTYLYSRHLDVRMFSDSNEGNEFYEQIPLKRIGQPMDIAQAVAFLASDESAYCTGTEIVVDGGMTRHTTVYYNFRSRTICTFIRS